MYSQMVQSCSPADLWHHRLNQIAHRLACVGWLMLPAVWLPAKVPAPAVAALVICAAIIAVVGSFFSSLLVAPDNNDRREAVGTLAFSLVLLATSWIVAMKLHLQIKPLLATWLRLNFDPNWLAWTLRAAVLLLAVYIAVVAILGRRGRA